MDLAGAGKVGIVPDRTAVKQAVLVANCLGFYRPDVQDIKNALGRAQTQGDGHTGAASS